MTLNLKSKPQTKTHLNLNAEHFSPGSWCSQQLQFNPTSNTRRAATLSKIQLTSRYWFFFSKEGVFDSCLLFFHDNTSNCDLISTVKAVGNVAEELKVCSLSPAALHLQQFNCSAVTRSSADCENV